MLNLQSTTVKPTVISKNHTDTAIKHTTARAMYPTFPDTQSAPKKRIALPRYVSSQPTVTDKKWLE
jgi:hypothetical protein